MTILNDLKNCFSFLTRFPINKEVDIQEDVAPKIWVFPIVGFVLGLISGFISLILFNFLPFLIVGFIILGLLLLMTGGHHADGLIDFGDGNMAIGSPERKIEAMHDVNIGVGGLILGLIILTISGIAISYSKNYIIFTLIFSEIGAKFGMVAACSIEKSAKTKMAAPFINLTKKIHMVISFLLSVILIYLTLIMISLFNSIYQTYFLIRIIFIPQNSVLLNDLYFVGLILVIFFIGTSIPLAIIMRLARKNFEGLTGDCLGALNEITRLFILILVIIFNSYIFF